MTPATRSNLKVAFALLGLLGAAAIVWSLDFGPVGYAIGLTIGVVKALLIAAFFMELRGSSALTRLIAGAAIYWMILLLALTLTDVSFR